MNELLTLLTRLAFSVIAETHQTSSVSSSSNDRSRKPRIVVLDDEPTITFTLAAIFGQAGYEVVTFHDGQELLAKVEHFSPDAALLDVLVPGLDGVSVAIRLTEMFPWCKVFLLSGTNEASPFLERAAGQGQHFEVLVKPVSPSVLLAALKSALEGGQPEVA